MLDPVLVATSGDSLGAPDVVDAMRRDLLPLATVVTPNLPEAARLADRPVPRDEAGMQGLAERIHAARCRGRLVKGGHLGGAESIDILFDGDAPHGVFGGPRRDPQHARHGLHAVLRHRGLPGARRDAGRGRGSREGLPDRGPAAQQRRFRVGGGHGPVQHFHSLWPEDVGTQVH